MPQPGLPTTSSSKPCLLVVVALLACVLMPVAILAAAGKLCSLHNTRLVKKAFCPVRAVPSRTLPAPPPPSPPLLPSTPTRSASVTTAAGAVNGGMSLTYGKPIVFNPQSGEHKGTIIILHGLGDTGAGWASVASDFQPALPNVKFIFPTAPQRPITLNWGMKMTGWFDINSLDSINYEEDREGLLESKRYVEELISKEPVGSERIVVAGFSQGGAMALLMLRSSLKLAGVAGLSSWMPLSKEVPLISEANTKTPIFMGHGDADQVVKYEFGKTTAEKLVALDANVEFNTYSGMAHSACPSELQQLLAFFKASLP